MVQFIPAGQNFADKFLDSFRRGMDNFEKGYEKSKGNSLFEASQDKSKTPIERTSALEKYILHTGDTKALLQFREQEETKKLLQEYQAAKRGDMQQPQQEDLANLPQLPGQQQPQGPMYGADQVLPQQQGQDQQQQPQVTPAMLDQSASPMERQPNQGKIDDSIAKLSFKNPALGKVLQQQETRELKQEQERERQLGKSYEMSQKYREKVIGNDQVYAKQKMLIDRLGEISDDPDYERSKPAFVTMMNKLGVPPAVWGNPTDEQIDKISNEFSKNIPEGWKGRILQSEFHALLRTLPGLSNSKEGMKLVARNMQLLMEPFRLEYEAMNALKKEYQQAGKKLPYDFQDQVYERMAPGMNAIAQEFARGSDEMIDMAERVKRGGTIGAAQAQKKEKAVRKSQENLPPTSKGKVRLVDDKGGAFDVPESAVKAALAGNKSLKRAQ